MKTKLFISTDLTENHSFRRFCSVHNLDLTAQSLITFKPLKFKVSLPFDVVFFSSIRSYNYFISLYNVGHDVVYAALGISTAEQINENISSFGFIGRGAGNPEAIGQDFKKWLGNRRVLFPLALHSNETISSQIPEHQKEEIRVYETLEQTRAIPKQDIYVFTSPSNVRSFLKVNVLPEGAKVIAWGRSTSQMCVSLAIQVECAMENSSFDELQGLIKGFE